MDLFKNAADSAYGQELISGANIKVFGVGGGGGNMVDWLYKKGVKGAQIIACNTDYQHLDIIQADKKFLIGRNITRGLGCGGFPNKNLRSEPVMFKCW